MKLLPTNMEEFSTYDLALAAFLRSQKHEMLQPEKDGNRFRWRFKETPELRDDKELYFDRCAQVEPASFFNEIRGLKSLIYAHKN